MTDDEELSEAYNLGYSCAKDMVKDEITHLRAENEKLREALKGMIDLAEAANVMDDPAYGAARNVLESGE